MASLPLNFRFESAISLAKSIRKKKISSLELLEEYEKNCKIYNPSLNAIVTTDFESARRRAKKLDDLAANNQFIGPLHGLPITVKDTFKTKGLRSTAGAEELSENIPTENAVPVQRVIDAGAFVFGKSNTPRFAADIQTNNKVFGMTNNPWDVSRTSGGSSGGSAAATAAGLTAFELGSDVGGSLRTPASFCGIYTIKPSFGIVPTSGLISSLRDQLSPRDISCVGPMARSAEDLDFLLDVLAAPTANDASAWQLELPQPTIKNLSDYRVAAWIDDESFPVDDTVKQKLEDTIRELEKVGVTVNRNARPDFTLAEAADVYLRLLACSSLVGMTDEEYETRKNTIENFPDAIKDRWGFNLVRYSLLSARDQLIANEDRYQLQKKWKDFFADYDILLSPVTQIPAFKHIDTNMNFFQDIFINNKKHEYAELLAWVGALAGVSYLPAVSAPIGLSDTGLPVGVQIIAPYLQDKSAIDFSKKLKNICEGFNPPPNVIS
ncbi:MAG: amidase [Cellvibrionaceae bacterium]